MICNSTDVPSAMKVLSRLLKLQYIKMDNFTQTAGKFWKGTYIHLLQAKFVRHAVVVKWKE